MKIECVKLPTIRIKGMGDDSADEYCSRCNRAVIGGRAIGQPFADLLCDKCLNDFAILVAAFKTRATIEITGEGWE